MPSPSPEAHRLAERYRLGLAQQPQRGSAGERLGKGTGSSLEFQDRRAYAAGDDVRHLDWRAYARTDQLFVRLYREEIAPRVELLVDDSRSMRVDDDKAQLVTDLAALFFRASRASGLHPRLFALGERPQLLDEERMEREGLALDGRVPLVESALACRPLLAHGALRILISDFLSPHDPASLVRSLAARAGSLALVQVLGAEDARPPEGALRLVDSEVEGNLDIVVDRRTLEGYKVRLGRLQAGLATECRRAGGHFVTVVAGPPLERLCRDVLLPDGLLVPA